MRRHPTPPLWLVLLLAVLAGLPFFFLGDWVGASERASTFLRAATVGFTVLAVTMWRQVHADFGPNAAQVSTLAIAFAGFIAMVLVSRMAAFPDPVFALPFLFPVWLAALLLLGSRLTVARTDRL